MYNPSANFWEVNPQFKTLTVFAEFYKKDRSTNKNKSSKVMWVICGITDSQSNYHDMPDDKEAKIGKYKTIGADLMKDENWWDDNIEKYQHLDDEYCRIYKTRAQRALENWFRNLEDRQKVFDETPYEIGLTNQEGKLVGSNVKVKDDMFAINGKLWAEYLKIMEIVEAENAEGGVKGGSMESGSDTGRI